MERTLCSNLERTFKNMVDYPLDDLPWFIGSKNMNNFPNYSTFWNDGNKVSELRSLNYLKTVK